MLFLLMFLICTAGYAERDNEIEEISRPIRSYEEQLAEYGVGVSKEALLAALSHPDPEVRSLAAGKLAEDRIEEAIPALRQVLAAADSWPSKISIGSSLARLGDASGFASLRNACVAAEPTHLRVDAARSLLDRGDAGCFDTLVTILAGDDARTKRHALNLLPSYKNIVDFNSCREKYIIAALTDKDEYLRLRAIPAMQLLGAKIAIPALESAADRETNEWLRARMLEELVRLKAEAKTEAPKQ
ncbi:MAG: HEAT repeat domain-containing protein [Thermoanaerobaculia bacterium]|nr:HEAT repeat domain-containing protein [Thermoanaerobaculia bacterium]